MTPGAGVRQWGVGGLLRTAGARSPSATDPMGALSDSRTPGARPRFRSSGAGPGSGVLNQHPGGLLQRGPPEERQGASGGGGSRPGAMTSGAGTAGLSWAARAPLAPGRPSRPADAGRAPAVCAQRAEAPADASGRRGEARCPGPGAECPGGGEGTTRQGPGGTPRAPRGHPGGRCALCGRGTAARTAGQGRRPGGGAAGHWG